MSTEFSAPLSRLRVAALGLLFLALWSLLDRYWGLQHDAQLYVLQALGRLEPDIYGQDLFLRFAGSAALTIFPVFSSIFVGEFGAAKGAAVATLLSHALWYFSAWLLIRRLMNRKLALLSFGLVLAVPVWYGSGHVFRLVEPFLSARPLAEALCLMALAALAAKRPVVAIVSILVGMSIHPLMAFPVLLMVVLAEMPSNKPIRQAFLVPIVLVTAAVLANWLLGGSEPLMTGQWLELTHLRSGYLFIDSWSTGDWQTSALPVATLALAALALPAGPAAVLSRATLIVGLAGMALTLICGGPFPLKLILQGQPWRWVWIGGFLALALLPLIVQVLWRSGRQGRTTALLLVAGWMLGSWSSSDLIPPVGAGALIAVIAVALWVARDKCPERVARLLLAGSWTLLFLSGAGAVASALAVAGGRFHFGTDPRWIELSVEIMKSFPPIAAAIVLAAWYLTTGATRSFVGVALVAGLSAALLIGGAAGTRLSWAQGVIFDEDAAKFAVWKAMIPTDAEVLWPDFPQGAWFLLERRSFLSASQLAGIVFSQDLAGEARRRAVELAGFADPDDWFGKACASGSECRNPDPSEACAAADLDFLVLETDRDGYVGSVEWPGPGSRVYLYRCAEFAVASVP